MKRIRRDIVSAKVDCWCGLTWEGGARAIADARRHGVDAGHPIMVSTTAHEIFRPRRLAPEVLAPEGMC